jgi:hypothetical protein
LALLRFLKIIADIPGRKRKDEFFFKKFIYIYKELKLKSEVISGNFNTKLPEFFYK